MNRAELHFLVETSLSASRPDYAGALAQAWLAQWPGDIGARFHLARARMFEERHKEAVAALESVTHVDLEHAAAHRLLGQLQSSPAAYAIAHALNGSPLPPNTRSEPPAWLAAARRAVTALSAGQYHSARQFAEMALRDGDAPPLASLVLLKAHWQAGQTNLALPLAEGFHERWPRGVAFILCLAEGLFRLGDSHRAVELLHTASALDPAGEVVGRYWGASHPYTDLWPQPITVPLPGPIPAEVSALLGSNRLAGPPQSASKSKLDASAAQRAEKKTRVHASQRSSAYQPKSEELIDIQKRLNAVAAKLSYARQHRRPVHLILYSANQLLVKFGPQASADVISLIERLGKITAKHRRRPVALLAPDDPAKLSPHGLATVDPANPWAIKMLLHDFDRQLARQGRAIGSLLIIGGDDLFPFHRLPNPTDDVDDDIPSDNPYGTIDDNYFLPDWPVGRLPSPCGRDPEPLCRLLQATIEAHQKSAPRLSWIKLLLTDPFRWRNSKPALSSIGYTANIWKEAALEVFAPIGSERQLHTSPPLDADSAPSVHQVELSYFNLHGIEDSPDWFGQRDFDDNDGPLYPTALKPADVGGNGGAPATAPRLIFTEACYGANILNKPDPDAAMCLRFLDSGALALLGSTKIAYGSISTPLIGADLLGRLFWEGLLDGLPSGEALRRAKVNLAQTMHKRQSFLDGEDQKTLISFVLYGDPLLPGVNAPARRTARSAAKSLPLVEPKVMEYESADGDEMKAETVAEIKSMLARYLPGAESAEVHLSRPLTPLGRSAKSNVAPTHRVYTLTKTFQANAHRLSAFARVTVNKSGKVVKVAVSK
jgi:hypothetical protein